MDVARTLTVAIIVIVGVCTISVGEDAPPVAREKAFASPQEVFEAFRKAMAMGDHRTGYECWGPEFRQHLVFEAFFALSMDERNERAQAVLRRFGPDDKALADEYNRQYLRKHGVNAEKMTAAYQKAYDEAVAKYLKENPPPDGAGAVPIAIDMSALPPRPEDDEALMREVVESLIADKAGFYAAASEIFSDADLPPPVISPLEPIIIRSDVASLFAVQTVFHSQYDGAGAKLPPIATKHTIAVEFCKLQAERWMATAQRHSAIVISRHIFS